jgi:hypothetical protein
MNDEKDKKDKQEEGLPPIAYHVTDNYVTAIIGGGDKQKDADVPKGLAGFWDLLAGATKDVILKEQLIDALKEDKESVDFLVNAIQDEDNKAFRPILLSLCWESGLDMHKHLNYFAGLAVETNDPMLLLELQTIIQDINPQDKERKTLAVELGKAAALKSDSVSKEIMNDLVYFLES